MGKKKKKKKEVNGVASKQENAIKRNRFPEEGQGVSLTNQPKEYREQSDRATQVGVLS